ncbi:MAG: alpha/beta fold hydrolase [Ardenticatenaceae bacterium]|nr:alpha/beta fold hydrolase [Ardenticatenaceae bacterium]
MKFWRKTAAWLVVLAAVLIFLWRGPRVEVDETIHSFPLPEDLEKYLKRSEGRFEDIRPNTEKKIIWADPQKKQKTAVAFIYLHGFSASRQETAPLLDLVGRDLEANIFYTRLSGHGRSGEAMGEATVNDWLNDATEALAIGRQLGEKVVVVGTSTGATLATWLVEREHDLLACIMLSPNLGLRDKRSEYFLSPWANVFVPLVFGRTRSRPPMNELDGKYWTTSYPSVSMLPMMGIVDHVRRYDFDRIKTPLMMIYSPDDVVIDIEEMTRIFNDWGTQDKTLLPVKTTHPTHHVIVGDLREPQNNEPVKEAIADFLTPLIQAAALSS